jgi:negative regulator of sigma E activity
MLTYKTVDDNIKPWQARNKELAKKRYHDIKESRLINLYAHIFLIENLDPKKYPYDEFIRKNNTLRKFLQTLMINEKLKLLDGNTISQIWTGQKILPIEMINAFWENVKKL